MGLVQMFPQISWIVKAVLETGGWNKKQLRNNNDFYLRIFQAEKRQKQKEDTICIE